MLVAVVSSAATAVVPARRGAAPCATATSGVAVAAEAAWDIRRRSSASFSTLQQSSQAFRHRSVVAQSRRALPSSSSSSLRGIEMGVKRSLGARQTHKRLLSSSTRSQAAGLFPSRLPHVCLSFFGNPSSFCICSSVSLLGFCVLSMPQEFPYLSARVSLETGSLDCRRPKYPLELFHCNWRSISQI
jgi:hypothetical protein